MFDIVDDPAFQLLVILIAVKEYNDARVAAKIGLNAYFLFFRILNLS